MRSSRASERSTAGASAGGLRSTTWESPAALTHSGSSGAATTLRVCCREATSRSSPAEAQQGCESGGGGDDVAGGAVGVDDARQVGLQVRLGRRDRLDGHAEAGLL